MPSKRLRRIPAELRLAYRYLKAILSQVRPKKTEVYRLVARFVDEYSRDDRSRSELLRRAFYVENCCRVGTPFQRLANAALVAYRIWEKGPRRPINNHHRETLRRKLEEAQGEAQDTHTPLTKTEAKKFLKGMRQRQAGDLEWARSTLSAQFEILRKSVNDVGDGIRWDNEVERVIDAIERADRCCTMLDPIDVRGQELQTALARWKSECANILNESDHVKARGCYFLYHNWNADQPNPTGWSVFARSMLESQSGYVFFGPMRDAAYVLLDWYRDQKEGVPSEKPQGLCNTPREPTEYEIAAVRQVLSKIGKSATHATIADELRESNAGMRHETLSVIRAKLFDAGEYDIRPRRERR